MLNADCKQRETTSTSIIKAGHTSCFPWYRYTTWYFWLSISKHD